MMTSSWRGEGGGGHISPGEGLTPHLANEDMQSDLPQEMVFLAPVSLSEPGYGLIFPALPLQECGKDAQLLSVSDAMSTLAGNGSTTYGAGLKCRRGLNDIPTGRDAEGLRGSFFVFPSASNSSATHLPYEPLGSIKVRKSVIIQRDLLFS